MMQVRLTQILIEYDWQFFYSMLVVLSHRSGFLPANKNWPQRYSYMYESRKSINLINILIKPMASNVCIAFFLTLILFIFDVFVSYAIRYHLASAILDYSYSNINNDKSDTQTDS